MSSHEIDVCTTKYFTHKNGKSKIEAIVDKILARFGGIYQSDYDDFYSLAGEVFWEVVSKYDTDRNCNFNMYLTHCLTRRIMDYMSKRNAVKRTMDREAISFSAPLSDSDDEEMELLDVISDPKTEIENEVFGDDLSDNMEIYLSKLTKKQREFAMLIMKDMSEAEIMAEMNFDYAGYNRMLESIKRFELVNVLM